MRILKLLSVFVITVALVGCGGGTRTSRTNIWTANYDAAQTGAPVQIQYGGTFGASDASTHRISVLLPTSGANAAAGRAVRTGIEMAILQRGPRNLSVSFFDTAADTNLAINDALNNSPEIIIGPMFANDARILRSMKPASLPVLSFTSDASAVGDGVMTMALMPTNSIEAIVSQMSTDGATRVLVLAPDSVSGHTMAGAARMSIEDYNMRIAGIYFYTERDSDSIKNVTERASLNSARTAAATRARAIISDMLNDETLTATEKSSLRSQMEIITRNETLGNVPYDAVLFLGGADDSKNLASFLRYYGVDARAVKFYGTAMWDGSSIVSDITMYGARYAALPEMNPGFANTYALVTGGVASRLASIGYDAANMAMGMIYSDATPAAYLLSPGGYVGIDGLYRLMPSGESQRGMRILESDGAGNARTIRGAPTNFITPIYRTQTEYATSAAEVPINQSSINAMNYINVPERLRGKYGAKTYGATRVNVATDSAVTVTPADDTVIIAPGYESATRETIGRTYIDAVEISN